MYIQGNHGMQKKTASEDGKQNDDGTDYFPEEEKKQVGNKIEINAMLNEEMLALAGRLVL